MLVGAGIGTVERLGSMTPEELEAISGINEEIVSQIQTIVVGFYSQYDEEQQAEEAPVTAEAIEDVIDAEAASETTTEANEAGPNEHGEQAMAAERPEPFENIETGTLEHDIARHEEASLEETEAGEVLDLGRVEGLSGAPSSLRGVTAEGETGEGDESDTIKNAD